MEDLSLSDHRLAGVVEKYNRGSKHFDDLRDEMDRFFNGETKPHASRGQFETDTWEWVERFQIIKEPPLRFGVMLGDCIHNLRSALDHLACQVTLLDLPEGGCVDSACDQTQFPIASKSEQQFEDMANFRIPRFTAEHRALVKRVQPYHAGDDAQIHPLAILADLSNADKHRVINPTFSFLASDTEGLAKDMMRDAPSVMKGMWIAAPGHPLEHDAPWLRIEFSRTADPPKKVEVNANTTLGIAFGEVGLDAVDFPKLAKYVWWIIETFMRDFPETQYTD